MTEAGDRSDPFELNNTEKWLGVVSEASKYASVFVDVFKAEASGGMRVLSASSNTISNNIGTIIEGDSDNLVKLKLSRNGTQVAIGFVVTVLKKDTSDRMTEEYGVACDEKGGIDFSFNRQNFPTARGKLSPESEYFIWVAAQLIEGIQKIRSVDTNASGTGLIAEG